MTKKVLMTMALAAMLVPLFAGGAFAVGQLVQCRTIPCYASGNSDLVRERVGNGLNDTIIMRGGDDAVLANTYTNDRDVVRGGTGYDKINVADGDNRDRAAGGGGRNHCIVDSRAEVGPGCTLVTVR